MIMVIMRKEETRSGFPISCGQSHHRSEYAPMTTIIIWIDRQFVQNPVRSKYNLKS